MLHHTSHLLFIDSRDRDFEVYPTPNEYRVRLPQTYYNVTSARLVSAEIPKSFYTFSTLKGNTSLSISVGTGPPQTVTIEDGNYTFESLKTALEVGLSSTTGLTWTIMFSSTTNRTLMFNAEGVDFTVHSLESDRPTDYGLQFYLGFRSGMDYTSVGGELSSDRPASFHGVSYIFMDIEELKGGAEGGLYGAQVGGRPFARLSMDPIAQGVAVLDTSKCTDVWLTQQPMIPRLKELRIRFRHHDGSIVDFNGVDHSFVMCLETRDFHRISHIASQILPPDGGKDVTPNMLQPSHISPSGAHSTNAQFDVPLSFNKNIHHV